MDMGQPNTYAASVSAPSAPPFQGYGQSSSTTQMPPPPLDTQSISLANTKQSPTSPSFNPSQLSPLHNVTPKHNNLNTLQAGASQYPDPTDSSLYNFNLADLNFGNHFGALEFGMLSHMTGDGGQSGVNSGQSTGFGQHMYDTSQLSEPQVGMGNGPGWATSTPGQTMNFPGNYDTNYNTSYGNTSSSVPNAFAIAAGSMPSTSPASSSDFLPPDGTAQLANMPKIKRRTSTQQQTHQPPLTSQQQSASQYRQQAPTNRNGVNVDISQSNEAVRKLTNAKSGATNKRLNRQVDLASIYNSITEPYPYTEAFHKLFALLRKLLTKRSISRIAHALASIRPSFISTTGSLVHEDLVFMEKYFQRSLLEYEKFIQACGTPTIILRRTGEVAFSSQEFAYMSGWPKDVLLGKDPNLNVNTNALRKDSTNVSTVTSSRGGFNTPAEPGVDTKPLEQQAEDKPRRRPQPVYLPELLDEDSVVKFYDDYAQLAFADIKGSVWSPCKILKYQPPHSTDHPEYQGGIEEKVVKSERSSSPEGGIASRESLKHLTDGAGKVSCMYCWMVKRDVFNIPMVIVMNVSLTRLHKHFTLNKKFVY